MDQLQQYLQLLQNGAYAAIIGAILSGINLVLLIVLLARSTPQPAWPTDANGRPISPPSSPVQQERRE